MRSIGRLEQFSTLHVIVQAIFARTAARIKVAGPNEPIQTRFNRNKNLWYVDHQGIRYIEQNPRTASAYAARARQGAKIVWVIRKSDNTYLGYVEDGEVFMKPASFNAYQSAG